MVSSRIAESAPKVDARNASSSCANTSGAGFFFLKNIGRGIGAVNILPNVPDDQSLLASGAGDAGNTASKGRESK